jgi:hypothetical protein
VSFIACKPLAAGIIGPNPVIDNGVLRWDGTTGHLVQDSLVYIDDSGNMGLGDSTPDVTGIHISKASAELRIETGNTTDPTLSFVTTNTEHQVDVYMDESASKCTINFEGITALQDMQFNIKAPDGEQALVNLFSGSNFCRFYMNTADNFFIHNATSNKDIFFQINDGGTTKNVLTIDGSEASVGIGNTVYPDTLLHLKSSANSAAPELRIESYDTADPTLSFVTTNTEHQIDISLAEGSADDKLKIEGKTAGMDTALSIYALDGQAATLNFYSGTNRFSRFYVNNADNYFIENTTQDKDILFYVNSGGVTKSMLRLDGSSARIGVLVAAPDTLLHLVDSAAELRIQTDDSTDPTLSFKTTATENQINISLDESATADVLKMIGQTSSVDTELRMYAQDGENCSFKLFSGSNNALIQYSASDVLNIQNITQDVDIVFTVNDGGTPTEVMRMDADVPEIEIPVEVQLSDKLKFTQTDGNEYIDSLADGYMDYGATTAHRFNNKVGLGIETPTAILHIQAGTVAASTAPVKFEPGVCLTTPEVGAFECTTSGLFYTTLGDRRSLVQGSQPITSSTTVVNTTTETTLYTTNLAADELIVGETVTTEVFGIISTHDAADTATLRVKVGGTTITTVVTTAGLVTDEAWRLRSTFTVRSVGAAGTVQAFCAIELINENKSVANIATTTVNTTQISDVTITVEWSDAEVDDSITVSQGYSTIIW